MKTSFKIVVLHWHRERAFHTKMIHLTWYLLDLDLEILQIASNTENHKVLKKHTHQSRNKNPLCGDEMEISLIVKDNIVQDMGYQCRSCVYCQASVSLLSRWVMQVPIEKISDFVLNAELFFDKNFEQLKKVNIKDFKDFKKIMNPENISRKECLLLPFKTLSKALKL